MRSSCTALAARTNPCENRMKMRNHVLSILLIALFAGATWLFMRLWPESLVIRNHPDLVYRHYEHELQAYVQQLMDGTVTQVDQRGYPLPEFLANNGAKWVLQFDQCYVIVFEGILDNPTPELWFCPHGDAMNSLRVVKGPSGKIERLQELSSHWASCYRN